MTTILSHSAYLTATCTMITRSFSWSSTGWHRNMPRSSIQYTRVLVFPRHLLLIIRSIIIVQMIQCLSIFIIARLLKKSYHLTWLVQEMLLLECWLLTWIHPIQSAIYSQLYTLNFLMEKRVHWRNSTYILEITTLFLQVLCKIKQSALILQITIRYKLKTLRTIL